MLIGALLALGIGAAWWYGRCQWHQGWDARGDQVIAFPCPAAPPCPEFSPAPCPISTPCPARDDWSQGYARCRCDWAGWKPDRDFCRGIDEMGGR